MRVPTRCDHLLTIDDVSGPATGLLTNAVSARIGDDLLTINGGTNGVTVLGAGLAVAGVARHHPSANSNPDSRLRAGRHHGHQSLGRVQ